MTRQAFYQNRDGDSSDDWLWRDLREETTLPKEGSGVVSFSVRNRRLVVKRFSPRQINFFFDALRKSAQDQGAVSRKNADWLALRQSALGLSGPAYDQALGAVRAVLEYAARGNEKSVNEPGGREEKESREAAKNLFEKTGKKMTSTRRDDLPGVSPV